MTDFQIYLTLGIFAAVIIALAADLIDMAIAALLGSSLMMAFGILEGDDLMAAARTAGGPLALLFGGMVVARVLADTGIFERIGAVLLRATGGSGRRFLLLLLLLVAPVCAVLPNATTVILLAPVIVGVARALDIDFVVPLILTALISNSAGLLTLVGDPATFLVGSSIGMTFGEYLAEVSLGGLLTVLAIIPLLPWLARDIWQTRRAIPEVAPLPPISRPGFVAFALAVLAVMVGLFLFGDALPTPMGPPAVSILGAGLALLVIYAAHVAPVDNVLRDVDWKTLVFLAGIFCLVQGFTKTGLVDSLSLKLGLWFGSDFLLVAMALLAGIGSLSSILANIPVVAAALVMVKGYLVTVEAVPESALAAGFVDWPEATLPVFIAMMFGATLGGNATLVGASANVVSVGICANNGRRVTFMQFMRYGLPIAFVQLVVAALYVLLLAWW
jgi:Na+/H+ antiporter NhaD/arsenite permease-like protein